MGTSDFFSVPAPPRPCRNSRSHLATRRERTRLRSLNWPKSSSDGLRLQPGRHRLADRRPGIFLDEMRARNGDLGLVFPAAAEVTQRADQDGAGIGADEQFWHVVLRHPARIGFDDF